MKFDKTLFKVKAGQEIKLKLTNIGKLPAAAMSHNVVILKPGTDVQAFGEAAVTAKDSEHIPQNMLSDVIAHTKMLGPGASDQSPSNYQNPEFMTLFVHSPDTLVPCTVKSLRFSKIISYI